MPIVLCPRCQQRILVDKNTDEVEHQCNSGNEALDNEDVVKVGSWTDYSGSGDSPNYNYQGVVSETQGTRAGLEGNEKEELTTRGARKSTTRSRPHLEFIEIIS